MGGLGKSELALQYAWRYRQEYAARYWLTLRGVGLAQAVVTLASRTLPLPDAMQSATLDEQAAWYWRHWLPQEGKVLVIFDDVTHLKSIPQQARPLADRFQVLVTTRKRKLSSQFADIPLDVISEDEALELLRKLLGNLRVDREIVAAKSICEDLGRLPLGVELAGRYLQLDEDLCLSDYRQRLKISDESLDLLETEEINATRGVIAAFELSWQELSVSTAKVAMLLGLFAPADIAWSLVEAVAAQLNIDEAELREGKKQLNNLCLIKAVDQDRTRFAMHSLTRQFLQWKLAQEPDINRLFRETFVMSLLGIAKEIPYTPTRDLIARVTPAIPHLDMLSREMLDDILNPEKDENLIWAFLGIAFYYYGQGLYNSAISYLENCLKFTELRLGIDHSDVTISLNNLAEIYTAQGKYNKAESLHVRALSIWKCQLGVEHPNVATSLNNLAELYRLQGKYNEAESLLLQAIVILGNMVNTNMVNVNHVDIATSLNNLANLYTATGKYSEAECVYKRSIEITQCQLGINHPDFATNINNLANLYRAQGKYKEAETLYQQSLEIWKHQLGKKHPNVATSFNNLAGLYESQGKYNEAEALYQQSLEIWEHQLGKIHPNVATSLNNLGNLYRLQGKYSKAEPLYLRSLQISQFQLRVEHPNIATSLNNLAELYTAQGKYNEAEPLYLRSLSIRKYQLGEKHPDVATSLNNLAILRCNQNRYDEAKSLFLQALEIFESVLGSNHPNTQSTKNSLANLRTYQGKS
jgi:tetratricopeptide (TPR) repeat protein